jgi:hypothetical protein
MKTKLPKAPAPTTEREPTDTELQEIEATIGEGGQVLRMASTPIDIARLGLNQLAYVRRAVIDDVPVWSIHSAMGHPLGAAPTLEQAWGAIMQNDLQPVFVH